MVNNAVRQVLSDSGEGIDLITTYKISQGTATTGTRRPCRLPQPPSSSRNGYSKRPQLGPQSDPTTVSSCNIQRSTGSSKYKNYIILNY
uniref:Uncharacterized protein n=1 Tax=Amphimedon queenslandica TaxID=400682 RepID=A0A1X7U044_AMPQE